MAGKSETPAEKVERLLANHDATLAVVGKHAERLDDAKARLDKIDGDMEMYAQHRDVPDDLREKVTAALKASAEAGVGA